jgi:glycosyltransferase involved in cell wall biosynthesis
LIYLLEACVILDWLKAEDVKHLHAHFGTNSAEVAMLVHALGGPPFSFTAHGPEEFDKARFIGLPQKIERAKFVVAVSSFGRSQLYRYTPYEMWNKIKVVHCGLEQAFYEGAPTTADLSDRLVCVGRLCEQKGQSLLIEAASLLAKRANFELVLAGDGEMRAEIEALIGRYGLEKIVRITGWISSDQVREEILAARALVLPSFAEGLPVVLMEAMALRRPVISTFIAGIPELVLPGEHGWLVPAGDVQALVAAMDACLGANRDVISAMGARARTRVLDRHDAGKEAAKLAGYFAGSTR